MNQDFWMALTVIFFIIIISVNNGEMPVKKVYAVIVAAGAGKRMNMTQNKQFVSIAGKPVLARTIQAFEDCDRIDEIVVVVNGKDIAYCEKEIIERYGFNKVKAVTAGGVERQDSVFNGLKVLDGSCDVVLIHDGARPFVESGIINRCIDGAVEFGSACAAVPVKDTLKISDECGFIAETPDRSRFWQVQTPQAFKYGIIMEAYKSAEKDGFRGTDDSVLVERLGYKTKLVAGSYYNIKITTREDLVFGEAICLAEF